MGSKAGNIVVQKMNDRIEQLLTAVGSQQDEPTVGIVRIGNDFDQETVFAEFVRRCKTADERTVLIQTDQKGVFESSAPSFSQGRT